METKWKMSCLSDFRCNTVDISNFRAGSCEGGTCRGISRWLHLKYKSLCRDKWMQCRCTLCSSLFVSRILKKRIFLIWFCKDFAIRLRDLFKKLECCNVAMGTQFFFFIYNLPYFLSDGYETNFFFKNLLFFSGSYKCKLENKRLCHVLMIWAELYSKCVCVQ